VKIHAIDMYHISEYGVRIFTGPGTENISKDIALSKGMR